MSQVSLPNAANVLTDISGYQRPERRSWAWSIALIAFSAVLYLPQLSGTRLFDQDEGYYASVAMEMHQRNDWILPTFNQELFAHKPPLMFWGMRLGYLLMGLNEVGARIGSTLAGILTVLVVFRLGRNLFDSQVGLFAGLAIASCLMFSMVARSATADAYLTLFVTASLGAWMTAYRGIDSAMEAMERLRAIPLRTWIQIYAWIGLALLTKGPIGFLFPATIIGLCVYTDLVSACCRRKRDMRHSSKVDCLLCLLKPLRPSVILRAIQAVRPLLGGASMFVIAAPWYMTAEIQSEGRFLQEFIGVHHLGRFSHAMDNHEGPFFYYAIACLIGMYPWSAFAIPMGIAWVRAVRTGEAEPAARWVTVWMAVYLMVFSIASTKLPNYVLPAYPGFALVAGYYMREVIRSPERWKRWQMVAWSCLILVGGLISLGALYTSWAGSIGSEWTRKLAISGDLWELLGELWWLGLPLIGIGIGGVLFQGSAYAKWLPFHFSAASALFLSLVWHFAAPKIYPFQAPQRLAEESRSRLGGQPRVVRMLDLFRPTALFYSQSPVEFTGTRAFVARRRAGGLMDGQHGELLLLRSGDWEHLQRELPGEYRVLMSVPNFPEMDELIAVGNTALLSEEK